MLRPIQAHSFKHSGHIILQCIGLACGELVEPPFLDVRHTIIRAMQTLLHGIAPLTHLGLIRALGDDAALFIHGQLTNDFSLLGLSEARLAGYCNAKGRLQASFIGFKRSQSDILLVCSHDILAATLQRLSVYVMRAKVRLTDASSEFSLFGLAGPSLRIATKDVAANARAVWARADLGGATCVQLYPADGIERGLWVAPESEPPPQGAQLSQQLWDWGEVRSGVATLTQSVVDAFVPQMLNYESVGGINFKKGCYPGQEVVARSQFRGTRKRHAWLAHSATQLIAGDEIFAPDDDSQPCGIVAQAAAAPTGGFDAIVSMPISAFESGFAHSVHGSTLAFSRVPYPLLDNI